MLKKKKERERRRNKIILDDEVVYIEEFSWKTFCTRGEESNDERGRESEWEIPSTGEKV